MKEPLNKKQSEISRRSILKTFGLAATAFGVGTIIPQKIYANNLSSKLMTPKNPYIYSFQIGGLEAWSISDGFMKFDEGLKLMAPDSRHSVMKQALEDNREAIDFLPMYINILVVRKNKEVIIFDAGYGMIDHPERGWFIEGLSAIGIDKSQVTAGFLSHAHGDHIDGFVGPDGKPMFPNAVIYTTSQEFNFWRQKNPDFSKSNRNPSWIPSMVDNAKKQFEILKPQIETVSVGTQLFDGMVTVENGFGHTPGHGIFRISSAGESLLHIVDLAHNNVLMFKDPAWSIRLDHSPSVAIESRRRVFAQAAKERTRCFGFHVSWPGIGSIAREGKGYTWMPERMWW
tara:strand:+ start:609 stop:1637 length:1029 start_codon:yes stop_codon:yes gene_type:complete